MFGEKRLENRRHWLITFHFRNKEDLHNVHNWLREQNLKIDAGLANDYYGADPADSDYDVFVDDES